MGVGGYPIKRMVYQKDGVSNGISMVFNSPLFTTLHHSFDINHELSRFSRSPNCFAASPALKTDLFWPSRGAGLTASAGPRTGLWRSPQNMDGLGWKIHENPMKKIG